jgi:hypothetical protein
MKYGWRGYSFDVPEDLDDETVVAFLAREGDTVDYNITVSRDGLDGKLDTYLADAVDELGKSLSGYQLVDQSEAKAGDRSARILNHKAVSPEGDVLKLRQAYIDCGAEVVIVTGTGREGSEEKLGKAFDRILQSFS